MKSARFGHVKKIENIIRECLLLASGFYENLCCSYVVRLPKTLLKTFLTYFEFKVS